MPNRSVKHIIYMGGVFKFRTSKQALAWASKSAELDAILNPEECGAKFLFRVEQINSIDDIRMLFDLVY